MIKNLLSVFFLLMTACSITVNAQQKAEIVSVKQGEVVIPLNNVNTVATKVTVSINGVEKEYAVTPGQQNITLSAPAETGIYDVVVTADNKEVSQLRLVNVTREVKHKVLFEEFTGLGCGWCPRGLVAQETAREMYGSDIVLISAHFDDPMKCKQYNYLKQAQLPSSHLDRMYLSIDPYFGTSGGSTIFGINEDIKKCAAIVPVAEVNVDASIDGDILTAKADVKMLYTGTGDYALGFVVTEDGIYNEKWGQLNNYNQVSGKGFIEEEDPRFEKWLNGDKQFHGHVYDDVAIDAQGIKKGLDNSMPTSFTEEESIIYETEFDLTKLKQIKNRKNLNVCVFLYDRTADHVINSNFMSFEHETAIEGVETDDENIIETARYTVDGCRIDSPQKGINIIKYSDGSIRKVIIK